MTEEQKSALHDVVRTNPLTWANAARRATQNLALEARIPPEMINSVRKNVCKFRIEHYKEMLGGTKMTGKYGDLVRFAAARSISVAVRNHNDGKGGLNLHDVFILSYSCKSDEDLHMCLTTPHMLLNWCRAFNSGHPVSLRMDAAFKLNRYQMCMYFMGFGSLGGHYNNWIYSIGSVEDESGYTAAFNAGKSAVIMALNNVRDCKSCEFCDHIREIKAEPKMIDFIKSADCKTMQRIPIDKAKGDNQDKSGNFVKNVLRLSYESCAAHAGPIAYKKRANLRKFRDHAVHGRKEDLFDTFHKFICRIMDADTEEQADFLQHKLVMWLLEKKQDEAADWFEKYWTGKKGRWTSAHNGYADVRTNSSQESFIGKYKDGALGSANRNTNMSLQEFMGATVDEITERSKEHHTMLINKGFGIASFQKFPKIDPNIMAQLRYVHPLTLWLSDTDVR